MSLIRRQLQAHIPDAGCIELTLGEPGLGSEPEKAAAVSSAVPLLTESAIAGRALDLRTANAAANRW